MAHLKRINHCLSPIFCGNFTKNIFPCNSVIAKKSLLQRQFRGNYGIEGRRSFRSSSSSSSSSSGESTDSPGHQWDIFASICLQRTPIIGPDMNWLERRLAEYLAKVEIADSLYSDHEMRHFEDLRRAERISSGLDVAEKDLEEAAKQTAADFEEASILEAREFTAAPRVTKADITNNVKSIDRSLDKHLYLAERGRSPFGDSCWLFPTERFDRTRDRSLRCTVERLVSRLFPLPQKDSSTSSRIDAESAIKVKYLGNTPAAYYCYRYSRSIRAETGMQGARHFLLKANLDPNSVVVKGSFGDRILSPATDCIGDFGWFTRCELAQNMPGKYWRTISCAIFPDESIRFDAVMQQRQRKLVKLSDRLRRIEAKIAQQQ